MARITERRGVRSGRSKRPQLWFWIGAPLITVFIVVAVYALRAGDDTRDPSRLEALRNDLGVAHVHGLGINPANGDVYAATHMGVFRITKRGDATRIANRYQDTMGFTVVGPNHFLASGHPDLREDLPPLLGLLESKDGARSWIKKSLLGEADFHALRYVHRTIYGYDSTGSAFMASRDGRRWDKRSATTMRDFVVSPEDRNVVLATTPQGLERSMDGGRTWKPDGSPSRPVLLGWDAADELWLVDAAGRIHLSGDNGKTWDERGEAPGSPEAFLVGGDRLYVAVEGGIYESSSGARSWKLFYREKEGRTVHGAR